MLWTPNTATTKFPVEAAAGTVTTICVVLQLVTVATALLNVTVPVLCVAPKFVPVMVTDVPGAPEGTDMPVTFGGGGMVTENERVGIAATPPTLQICVKVPTLLAVQVKIPVEKTPYVFVFP